MSWEFVDKHSAMEADVGKNANKNEADRLQEQANTKTSSRDASGSSEQS